MGVKCLFQNLEIRNAIRNTLDVRRRASDVRIMTMNLGDFYLKSGSDLFLTKIYRLLSAGVVVTILIGGRVEKFDQKTKSLLKDLVERGAKIYYNKNTHAKLILVNSKHEKLVLITSANFTKTALYKNYEIGVEYLNMEENIYKQFERYIIEKVKDNISTKPINQWIDEWGDA